MTELVTNIKAEGYMGQLTDEVIESYEAVDQTITVIVTAMLAFQKQSPAITVGTIQPTVTRSILIENDTLLRALLKLRDTHGGYIEVDSNLALNWWNSVGEDTGQQIRYRKNLMGITRKRDYQGTCQKIFAYGAGEGDARIQLDDLLPLKEAATKSADATYGYLTLSGQYSCYKNWTALAAACPAEMVVYEDDVDVTADWTQGADEQTLRCAIGDYNGAATYTITYRHANYLWDGTANPLVRQHTDRRVTHPDTLIAWGRLYLTECHLPITSYEIDTIDLSASQDELADYSFEELQLGSVVKVIDEDLGIDVETFVVGLTNRDLRHPEDLIVELSTSTKDISDYLAEIYDTEQLNQHIATEISAGQVIVKAAFTVIDWVTAGETTIDGANITTGSLIAEKIATGTLNATVKVDGAIKTGAGDARVEITAAGIKAFDSGGIQRVFISTDGSGWLGSAANLAWTSAGILQVSASCIIGALVSAFLGWGSLTTGTSTDQSFTVAGTTGLVKSDNYVADTSGWQIDSLGNAEFNSVKVRGSIYTSEIVAANTLTVNGTIKTVAGNARVEITPTGIKAYDATPTQRVQILSDGSGWLGGAATFSWTTAGVLTVAAANVSGELTAATLSAASLLAGTIEAKTINIKGATGILKSDNYVALTSGWQIEGDGDAEFNDITVRGTIYNSNIAAANVVTAIGGIESDDYVADTTGWRIDGIGNAEFNSVVLRGTLYTSSIAADNVLTVNGTIRIVGEKLELYDGTGLVATLGSLIGVTYMNAASGKSVLIQGGAAGHLPVIGLSYVGGVEIATLAGKNINLYPGAGGWIDIYDMYPETTDTYYCGSPTLHFIGMSTKWLSLKETTTPSADTNHGKIYTKSDNLLYFQDGAGVEHALAYA